MGKKKWTVLGLFSYISVLNGRNCLSIALENNSLRFGSISLLAIKAGDKCQVRGIVKLDAFWNLEC